ncbi:NACHT domain-containing protein [Roseateles sp. So40a]|uniref:NACHT domain-containing protein n=1 Tax=Roseateles sp. So40a TaxID=3400226 RepID=UPI003A8427D1
MSEETMEITWQDLENLIRGVASVKYGQLARAEDIAGVKCDCVVRLDDGSVVLIEISKEHSIDKVRTDIAKFNTLRPHFFAQNIFPKCFFITLDRPTPAMIEAGKSQHIGVYSVSQFFEFILGYGKYKAARKDKPFGSAVDLYSGQPDMNSFVPVTYVGLDGKNFSVDDIAEELLNRRTVVLIGDYGSGKSRCIKEVFDKLSNKTSVKFQYPFAINLRENWGLKRAKEILTRHFTDLGLSEVLDQTLASAYSPASIYLLDGFDEIGAQAWSNDPARLVDIRKQSLVGVKELVTSATGGLLITGREHYFNNDVELMTCLGLLNKNPLVLRCNEQLNNDQFAEMLGRRGAEFPAWMPKKPLIATIARDIDPEMLDLMFSSSTGEADFWDLLINSFCEREARINSILEPHIIRSLYTRIGRLTRNTATALGPISIKHINEAFEETTGQPPTDESAIVLQRLPGLSRIGAESMDRQFADLFILDGLKAEDVLDTYSQGAPKVLKEEWKNPVGELGAYFIGAHLESTGQAFGVQAFVKRHMHSANKVLLADLLSGLLRTDVRGLDFQFAQIEKGKFTALAIGEGIISNLQFVDCQFDFLDVTDCSDAQKISLKDCVIERIAGVSSAAHSPAWLEDCIVDDYQSVNTLAAIKDAGLTFAQTFLLSSLRKLFLQPGGGRKEASMYKGYGDSTSKRISEKVMHLLCREKICSKFKGGSDSLYIPDRSMTGRVHAIMSQLTTSNDPLWVQASRLE